MALWQFTLNGQPIWGDANSFIFRSFNDCTDLSPGDPNFAEAERRAALALAKMGGDADGMRVVDSNSTYSRTTGTHTHNF